MPLTHLSALLHDNKVVPVVAVPDVQTALRLAEALLKGGVTTIELTLRTDAGLPAITALRNEFPSMLVGCGTLKNAEDVARAVDAGSQFLVSPGTTPALADALIDATVPALPGAATLSEMMVLRDRGFQLLKLFPAVAAGGINMLKSVAPVLPDLQFCPTGGVNADNYREFLNCDNVLCVGGSWIAPPDLIASGAWHEITALCQGVTGA